MPKSLAPGLERVWDWEVWESPPCPHFGRWHLCKLLNVCGPVGSGASSLILALSFQVTNIHALALGLLSDLEVNTSHMFLPPTPSGTSSLTLTLSSFDSSVN